MAERTVLGLLQRLYGAFAVAIVLVGVMGATLPGALGLDPQLGTPVAIGIVLVAIAAATAGTVVLDRPLPCTDAGAMIGAYRTRLLLRVATAELPVLAGFAASMLAAAPGPALLGLGASAIRLLLVVPNRASVEEEAERLRLDGCGLDLLALLTTPLDGGPDTSSGPIS